MLSDFELLDAWRGGDADAGRLLFERHFEAVYRFFFNKVGDETDDLLQQTFLACVEGRDSFQKRSSFRAYVLGIAKNKLFKFVRSKARNRIDGPPTTGALIERGSIASALAREDEQRLLLRALRELPIDLQIALELAYWEELTDRELAAVLELPMGTVKSRLRKARRLLDDALAELANSPGMHRATIDDFDTWVRSIRALVLSPS